MDFDKLKLIWDTQNGEPLWAIDRRAMHALVKKRTRAIAKNVVLYESFMVALLLGLAIAYAVEPVLLGQDYHQLPTTALLTAAAMYVGVGVWRRMRGERGFASTLLGELDKAIAHLDYRIGRSRTMGWWLLAPALLGVSVSFVFLYRSKEAWIWLAILFGFVWSYLATAREVRTKLLPQKRELESLRDRLLSAEG